MKNTSLYNSFSLLFTIFTLITFTFFTSCGGDDSPEPDCSNLALTATAEGFTVTATASGGATPYQFQIGEGASQSSATFADLETGTYVVTVTDANNCTKTQSVEVNPCAEFSVVATASAYDITIDVEGGNAPYSYLITYTGFTDTEETNEQTAKFSVDTALATGIVVTDANGCEVQTSLTAEQVRAFTDSRDGQEYLTIKIGDQIWFAENLNFETENNSYCYDDDPANCETYGRLYNSTEVLTAAPEGWHVASRAEWETLVATVGGEEVAVEQLEAGGESGFNAFYAGIINAFGNYRNEGDLSSHWTSSSNTEVEGFNYVLLDNSTRVLSFFEESQNPDYAFSVRLLKN